MLDECSLSSPLPKCCRLQDSAHDSTPTFERGIFVIEPSGRGYLLSSLAPGIGNIHFRSPRRDRNEIGEYAARAPLSVNGIAAAPKRYAGESCSRRIWIVAIALKLIGLERFSCRTS